MEYPKIQSLFKRGCYDYEKTGIKPKHGKLLIGEYSLPEFALVNKWQVFEKIDGTNTRITYINDEKGPSLKFDGRTSESKMPAQLLHYLAEKFTIEKMQSVFKDSKRVILFGEGYGPKIQRGGNYRKDVAFIGFDIFANGWWLKTEDAMEIFHSLGVSFVPFIDTMYTSTIIEYVKSKPRSKFAENREYVMEGVVCRTEPMLFLRNGEMLKFKLKCKDMENING